MISKVCKDAGPIFSLSSNPFEVTINQKSRKYSIYFSYLKPLYDTHPWTYFSCQCLVRYGKFSIRTLILRKWEETIWPLWKFYVMFKTRAAVFYRDLKPRGAAIKHRILIRRRFYRVLKALHVMFYRPFDRSMGV